VLNPWIRQLLFTANVLVISIQACEGFRSLIQKEIGLVEKSMHGSTGKQETS
jgi:hypothetical protein